MAADFPLFQLLSAVGLLCIPLIVAIPVRLLWRRYLGSSYEHDEYRNLVRLVVDSGHSLPQFRDRLDEAARRRRISREQQKLIETDILYPLTLPHFILLPSLLFAPIALLFATPLFLLALPLLSLNEYLLIRRGVLAAALVKFQRLSRWQVVPLPRPRHSVVELRGDLVAFSQMLTTVYLGLFAWLMVHWILRADLWVLVLVSSLVYLGMVSLLSVVHSALNTEFAFADPAGTSIIPIESWFNRLIEPLVGIGLVFLLLRDITTLSREGGDLVMFSLTLLLVLFSATLVALGIEVTYATRKRPAIQAQFMEQVITRISPATYHFTRKEGRIALISRGQTPLDHSEREKASLQTPTNVVFSSFEKLDSAVKSGELRAPTPPTRRS